MGLLIRIVIGAKGTGWTIAGGVASFSGGTGADLTQTGLNVEANKAYQISFDMTQISGGGFRVVVDTSGSFVSQYFTTTAQHTVVFRVGATSTRLRLSTLGGATVTHRQRQRPRDRPARCVYPDAREDDVC